MAFAVQIKSARRTEAAERAGPAGRRGPGGPPAAAVAVLLAAVAAGVVAQGAYYAPGRLLVLGLAAVACGVSRRRSRTPVPLACAALAAWVALRALGGDARWFGEAAAAVATLAGLALAVPVLAGAGAAARRRGAEALVGIGVLVAIGCWAGVAWRLPRFAVLVEHRLWRGAATLTYPNAAAAVLVPLALVALALLVARPRSIARAGAGYLVLVGTCAALSRAGFIALGAGLLVLARLVGWRALGRALAPLALGTAIAAAALAPSVPAGAPPRPGTALAGLVAGAAVALLPTRLDRRRRAAVLATAGALALAACVVGGWVLSGRPAPALRPLLASRGNLDSSGRSGAARAALALIREHPVAGTGIGPARFLWLRPDGNLSIAQYAHDEYLQLLVDLGLVGLALLAGVIAAIVLTARRGRTGAPHHHLWAGAVAALVALAVHSGFDFLWHIAVLPLLAGVLTGVAARHPATSEEPHIQWADGPDEGEVPA
jgi:O-Antigen ligase